MVDGYFLKGIDGEYLLVVKTKDEELLCQIVRRLAAMRQKDIRRLGVHLQEQLPNDD